MYQRSIVEKTLVKLKKVPILVPLFVTLVCIYGFIILYSAADGSLEPWALRQIMIFCVLMPFAFVVAIIDLKYIYKFSYIFYFFTLLLLIAAHFFGKTVMGATRWIDLGFIHLQPSEPAKIAVVLMLARYFHGLKTIDGSINISHMIIPLIGVLIPAALIIKQPDLGTGIITIIVATVIFFASGIRVSYFVVSIFVSLASLPLIWSLLHNYQKNRVLIFLDPGKEPLGSGYNIIQSKISIGSGGFFGKGLLNGTQSHLNFLPEYETDFIFSFLAEELGFVGGMLLLILYFMIIISSLAVAINAKSIFAKLMTTGLASIFFSHVFINMAMVMGMVPVVGVPLPLISYGGTMMVSVLICFGLIMNVGVHQHSKL